MKQLYKVTLFITIFCFSLFFIYQIVRFLVEEPDFNNTITSWEIESVIYDAVWNPPKYIILDGDITSEAAKTYALLATCIIGTVLFFGMKYTPEKIKKYRFFFIVIVALITIRSLFQLFFPWVFDLPHTLKMYAPYYVQCVISFYLGTLLAIFWYRGICPKE